MTAEAQSLGAANWGQPSSDVWRHWAARRSTLATHKSGRPGVDSTVAAVGVCLMAREQSTCFCVVQYGCAASSRLQTTAQEANWTGEAAIWPYCRQAAERRQWVEAKVGETRKPWRDWVSSLVDQLATYKQGHSADAVRGLARGILATLSWWLGKIGRLHSSRCPCLISPTLPHPHPHPHPPHTNTGGQHKHNHKAGLPQAWPRQDKWKDQNVIVYEI